MGSELYPLHPLNSIVDIYDYMRVPVKKSDRKPGPYPYYGASGIVDYVDSYLFDGEYLLLAEDGENLRSLNTPIVFMATGKFWVNNHAHILKGSSDNSTKYIHYALQYADIQSYISGSTRPKLTQSDMKQILVHRPDPREQRAIAHILGSLDDKIELNRQMNQTLEAMAQAIFKNWFVDFEPVKAKMEGRDTGLPAEIADLFPDSFEESELGLVPKGWRIVKLPEIVDKYIDNRGKTPPIVNHGIPLLEVKHLPDNCLKPVLNTSKFVTKEVYQQWFRSHLQSFDIIISTVGTIGRICIVPPESTFAIAQNLLGIRFNTNHATPLFMYYQMSSERFRNDINARLVITVQESIKRKDLVTIDLLKPPIELQRVFDKYIRPNVMYQLSDNDLSLSKLRDTLLPKLISGELRVPDVEGFLKEASL